MPFFPAAKTSRKTLAALLLPTWLNMQEHPIRSPEVLKKELESLEKVLED